MKRSIDDLDLPSSPSPKRARNISQTLTASSTPTLIESLSASPPAHSSRSSNLEDGSSDSDSSETSSSGGAESDDNDDLESAGSSSARSTRSWEVQRTQLYNDGCPIATNADTSADSGSNSDSLSSTSASISDNITDSSSSASKDDISSPSSTSSSSSSNASNNSLSAENLSTLQSRLDALLPKIRSKNQELGQERATGTLSERNIENVKEEDESYIEMDLGLGVLEERGDNSEYTRSDLSCSGSEDVGDQGREDVLATLMGAQKTRAKKQKKVGIEDLTG